MVRKLNIAIAAIASAAFSSISVAQDVSEAETTVVPTEQEPSEDNIAASLNARQKIKQDFTLTHKVNGEVVETTKRSVTVTGTTPRRTEAGVTLAERLSASYDRELLTRSEAYEEGKVNFALGDIDRDKKMSEDEFLRLLDTLKEHRDDALNKDTSLRKSFIAELDDAAARTQFKAIAGERTLLDEKSFVLAFLAEFDRADTNKDGVVKDAELTTFRSAILDWTKG